MKKIFALAASVILTLMLTVTAYAASREYASDDYGFSVALPEDYTVIDRDNLSKNKDFIEDLGYTANSFSTKLEQANIVMYAATADNSHQVNVKRWQSDFSQEIDSLAKLKEEPRQTALDTMAKSITDKSNNQLLDASVEKVGDAVYLRYVVRADGKFCYTEYITVVNKYCYSLVYYNSSAEFTEAELSERDKIIESFKIDNESTTDFLGINIVVIRIISAVAVIAAVIFAVYIISSFVRDIRNRRNSPEVIPDHIKMKHK